MAEERLREKDAALDEMAVWEEWDKCTEAHFRELRADAGAKLKAYVDNQRVAAIRAFWSGYGKKLPGRVGIFIAKGAANALISALTLILIGVLVLWIAPELVKMARGRVDVLLPPSTQPERLKEAPSGPQPPTAKAGAKAQAGG